VFTFQKGKKETDINTHERTKNESDASAFFLPKRPMRFFPESTQKRESSSVSSAPALWLHGPNTKNCHAKPHARQR
jgi:hypothetical protein